jgi:hypothetical protein
VNWSLVISHWSLVIGHWSLVIGHWSKITKLRNYEITKLRITNYELRIMVIDLKSILPIAQMN